MRKIPQLLIATLLALWLPDPATGQSTPKSLLSNSRFTDWQDGKPENWNIMVGATNGGENGPKSTVMKGPGPSLQLTGNKRTSVWNYISQPFQPESKHAYVLRVSAKSTGIKREGNQFNNCHASYTLKDQRGRKQKQKFFNLQSTEYSNTTVPIKPLADTATVEVGLFLSKTGKLNVRLASVEAITLANSFDVLVEDMDRNYSYFEHKNINWKKLTGKYRERATAAQSATELKAILLEMLAEMNDGHVWINHREQKHLSKTKRKTLARNYDFAIVDSMLETSESIGEFGLVGKTKTGFGYIRITSLIDIQKNQLRAMLNKIEGLFDTPGIVLDLRRNRGGAEPVAAQIASLFATESYVYGRSKFRSGPRHNDFVEAGKRSLHPRQNKTYRRPIVCLVGPGTVSSAEGFAMMMSAIPRCQVIGQPTRGSSGNPAPIHLVDGIEVYYSRWVSMMPDGTPIEDTGIPVDEAISHQTGSDSTFLRGLEILESEANR